MRQAPPADAACASGGWWRRLQIVLHALAAAAPAAWLAGHLQAGVALTALAAILSAVAGGLWAGRRLPSAAGRLRWDGQAWQFDAGVAGSDPRAGHAEAVLDLGPWLLVRWWPHEGGAARWWALADGGGGLQPVRVALHAGAAGAAGAAGETTRAAPGGAG